MALAITSAACSEPRVLGGACTTDCTATVHPAGILDPTSDAFHGKELARRNWDFPLCASCHGTDFTGGVAQVSCLGCHAAGPTACTTCHGAGPTSQAHGAHAATVACAECHVVPARWDDDGHILHDGIAITTPPPIVFGARAHLAGAAPSWDGASCTNTYCHGAQAPRWDDPTPAGTCDRCHGNPPPSHARADCAACHPANAPHIDGIVQIGRSPGCGGCHGSATSAAPPTDLAGNQFTTAIGVGAHQVHLGSTISTPIACSTCHLVPATLQAAGHIDTPAPAEVVAAVGWDRASQTCTASCHGPARPVWTSTGQVSCGTCHGIPPASAPHTPDMPITSCASCHPRTVDAFGNIIVTAGTSTHINGVIDAL